MIHCVDCWSSQQQANQATYIYDGFSVCFAHLEDRRSRMVDKPKVEFVDEPKPRKKGKK